jgi:DNA-binding phage protein
MQDPEFAAGYRRHRARIDRIDAIVRLLDRARIDRQFSKAQVARAAGLPAQSVRRFFTRGQANPSLETTIAIAEAVGVSLLPEPDDSESRRGDLVAV